MQLLTDPLLAGEFEFVGQSVQLPAPAKAYVLTPQSAHPVNGDTDVCPAPQLLHDPAPAAETCPAAQSLHDSAPSPDFLPAAHVVHSPHFWQATSYVALHVLPSHFNTQGLAHLLKTTQFQS
jgi:hypothetical protein